LEEAEAKIFHYIDGGRAQQISDPLAEKLGEGNHGFRGILCGELPEWEEEVGGNGVGEVPS
jgi:hypothetical protein